MTRACDVEELIAEQASGSAEQRGLEGMARRLESRLGAAVPYRPEFRAQLRQRLVATARRQLRPWYRRPAFLGSSMAVAAAAAVLVVGLNLWQTDQVRQVEPQPISHNQPAPPPKQPEGPTGTSFRVSLPSDLKEIQLPDERVGTAATPSGALTPALAPSLAEGLQLKQLTARPAEDDFRAMATRLAFRGESRRTLIGWAISEENRSLSMTSDGEVAYAASATAAESGRVVDAQGASQLARRFLDQALLPVYSQPAVTEENGVYRVVYTEQVDGRPVVNARTVIEVSEAGAVRKAQAHVASGVVTHTTYPAVLTAREALERAASQGGKFDRADLVWVRTPGEGTVYLQPYWRAFGTDGQGTAIARYVPALKR